MTDTIELDRDGAVWRVTLNRPEKANALNQEMLHTLHDVFASAAGDEALRVLTITGAGGRVFCAGADLSELSTNVDDPAPAIWAEMAEALALIPVLTVAMINGACIGGGMTLALGCDLRVSVPEAAFAYPVLRNGIIPGERDATRLRYLIGPGRSSVLLLGGERIGATEALAWGLVDRVAEQSDLDHAVATMSETAINADRAHLAVIKKCCRGE